MGGLSECLSTRMGRWEDGKWEDEKWGGGKKRNEVEMKY